MEEKSTAKSGKESKARARAEQPETPSKKEKLTENPEVGPHLDRIIQNLKDPSITQIIHNGVLGRFLEPEELETLAGPLFTLPWTSWCTIPTCEDRLSAILAAPKEDKTKWNTQQQSFLGNLESYRASYHVAVPRKPPRCVSVSEIFHKLLEKRPKTITKSFADKAADFLCGVVSIDYAGSESHHRAEYDKFEKEWILYLGKHPELLKQMDPVYAVVEGAIARPVGGYPVLPASGAIDQPALLHAQPYAWVFKTLEEAYYYIGRIHVVVPSTRVWVFNCATPLRRL